MLVGLEEKNTYDIGELIYGNEIPLARVLKLAKMLSGSHVAGRALAILLVPDDAAKGFLECPDEVNTPAWAALFSEDAIASRAVEMGGAPMSVTIEALADFFSQNGDWIRSIMSFFSQTEEIEESNPDI